MNFVRNPVYHTTYTNRRNSSPTVNRSRRNGVYQTTYEGKVYQRPERPVRVIGVPRASERRTNAPSVREQRNYNPRDLEHKIAVPIPTDLKQGQEETDNR